MASPLGYSVFSARSDCLNRGATQAIKTSTWIGRCFRHGLCMYIRYLSRLIKEVANVFLTFSFLSVYGMMLISDLFRHGAAH